MSKLPNQTESALQNLAPAQPDESFIDRLNFAIEGELTQLGLEDIEFAADLKAAAPFELSQEMKASLLSAVASTPFPQDDKIVLLPGRAEATARNIVSPKIFRWDLAAAAAVAVIGLFSAFTINLNESSPAVVETVKAPSEVVIPTNGALAPASFGSTQNQPKNTIHLEYSDPAPTEASK